MQDTNVFLEIGEHWNWNLGGESVFQDTVGGQVGKCGCSIVGWQEGVLNNALKNIIWTSLILVLEKVFLCPFRCGDVNIFAFSWDVSFTHLWDFMDFDFSPLWAWAFSPGVWRRLLGSDWGLQQYSWESWVCLLSRGSFIHSLLLFLF